MRGFDINTGFVRFLRLPLVRVVVCLTAGLIIGAGLPAGVHADDTVAATTITADGISFSPTVKYEKLVISVGGPGDFYFSEEFADGAPVGVGLTAPDGTALPDGQYAYELRVVRAGKKRADLSAENGRNGTGTVGAPAPVQSGYFRIQDGGFVVPGDSEPAPVADTKARTPSAGLVVDRDPVDGVLTNDYVIIDDLIVDGSACIGFDCVNGESFGFDTIRLKENNLRIKFQDTSSSASFPSNDWQISANDSSNGGANKFSIDDISGGRTPFTIEAGARSHALYVDDGGRIGFGTSTPVVDLHVKNGNTPTLRLEQDGSSGFTPQTWDVAGNEANFFIRDATNGSRLPFRIQPGAPSSSIYIDTDGNVGLGTSSPAQKLHVKNGKVGVDGTTPAFWLDETDSITKGANIVLDGGVLQIQRRAGGFGSHEATIVKLNVDAPVDSFVLKNSGYVGLGTAAPSYPLQVATANNAHVTAGGVWTNGSSREYKENIAALSATEAYEAFRRLQPVEYNYKKEADEKYVGFIAEDVPDLVAQNDRKSLSPMDIVAVLTRVVQEQDSTITRQNAELKALMDRIELIEKRIKDSSDSK